MPASSESEERRLVGVAAQLVATETPERIERLISVIRTGGLTVDLSAGALQDRLGLPAARLALYVAFVDAGRNAGAAAADLILALTAALATAEQIESRTPLVEIARTGPAGSTFHLRTTGSVSRDIIDSSTRTLLVVGYSVTASAQDAGLAAQTLASIRQAAARGVVITALLHRDPKNRDAILASWPAAAPLPSVFTWPESPQDTMAKLHAKVIVADSADALVSSANLTYHGYDANIELGVRVTRDPARLVEEHFRELIRSEELVVWDG